MQLTHEMVWLQLYAAALRGGANSNEATYRADHGLEQFKVRFPESKGNG